MKAKLAGIAIIIGTGINTLLIVIPASQQVRYYEGFTQPSKTDYTNGPQQLCLGVNFQIYKSVRKTGYPTRSTVNVDFDDCMSSDRFDTATSLFVSSLSTFNFYLNWLFWALLSYGALLLFR